MAHDLPERFRYHVSTAELERRWSRVREKMGQEELDCLILNAHDGMLGGYLRYFSDIFVHDYPLSALFHREDQMTFLGHGGPSGRSISPMFARGIGSAPAMPMLSTMYYTDRYIPDLMIREIRRRGYKRVGYVALALMPATQYRYIREALPGVELVDATDLVDRIRAIKSPEEIEALRRSCKMHDQIHAAMPAIVRPGRYEYELTADIRALAGELGAECTVNISLGTDPEMKQELFRTTVNCEYKRIAEGDKLFTLIELSGPGGNFSELLRVWSLGEPTPELVQASDAALESQAKVSALLRPGAKCPDLYRLNNEILTSKGYLPEERLFGHSQGYDMVERPALVPEETMELAENMFITVHPFAVSSDKGCGVSCMSYLITSSGHELLSKTQDGLIVL